MHAWLAADVNVQGHLPYLKRLIEKLGFLQILDDLHLSFLTFPELGLDPQITDRELWNFCQKNRLVLFTKTETVKMRIHSTPQFKILGEKVVFRF